MLAQGLEHFGDCRTRFGIGGRSAGRIDDRIGLGTHDLLPIDE
jgi:hypothetical protein